MYCRNCGREIKEGCRFCPGCGASQGEAAERRSMPYPFPVTDKSGIRASDVLIIAMYVLAALLWARVLALAWEDTRTAFGLLGRYEEIIASVLFVLPAVLLVVLAAIGIKEVTKKKYHVSIGIIIVCMSALAKVGSLIFSFDRISWDMVGITGYRVFAAYVTDWILVAVFGALAGVLSYMKNSGK